MIIIKSIDSYRDGGTIGVTCRISDYPEPSEEVEICLNLQLGGGDKKLYHGYPKRDKSNLIEDKEFINKFIEMLEHYAKKVDIYSKEIIKNHEK